MKKLLFTLALGLLSFVFSPLSLKSQTIPPPYINYQAVLYDVNSATPNAVFANQSFPTFVNIQDELGNLLYKEEHYASTDANGLITVKMGDGVYMAGPITNFNLINWGVGKYYLIVDFDINGTISSTAPEQLVTVPYSFYAGKAGNGMTAVADNGNGTLTFTYANGATYTTPTLSGIQGPAGPVGATGPAGPSGASGTAGTDGQSAYDLWLAQGNTGTVQDFLSTSAYQIWLAQGNTGTAQDFLNTLVGPQGPQGIQGIQGIQGPAGNDGAIGAQGPIGLTGVTGPQGIQGPAGNDGATGPQGPQGPIGLTGPTGPNGRSAYEIALLNGFVGTETQWLLSLVGATGSQGIQGATGPSGATGLTGPAGAQGLPGTNGTDGADGAVGAQGPQGIQGPIGLTGTAGPQGIQGPIGPSGTSGPAGPQGIQGNQGPVGTNGATGPQGPIGLTGATGPQGLQGIQGPAGSQGQNGIGISSTVVNSNGTITFNYSDGSSYTTVPASSSNGGNFFSNIGNIETNNSTSAYGRVFALDSNENIYVLGDATQGINGAVVTIGDISISTSSFLGNYMPFLCKINSDGSLSWLIKLANTGSAENVRKIATDSSGIYVAFTETVCKYSFSGNLIWSVNNGNSVALILRNNNVLYSLEKVGVAGSYDISIATYSSITGSLLSSTVVLSGTGEQIPIDMAIDNVGNIYYIGTSGTGGSYIRKISSTYTLIWSKSNTNSSNIYYPLRSLILSNNYPIASSQVDSQAGSGGPYNLTFNASTGTCFGFDPTTGMAVNYGNHSGELAYSTSSLKTYHSCPVWQTYGSVQYIETHNGIKLGSITETSDYLMPLSQSNSGTIDDMFISNDNVLYILGSSQYPFVNGLSGQVVTFLPGSTKIFLIKAQL